MQPNWRYWSNTRKGWVKRWVEKGFKIRNLLIYKNKKWRPGRHPPKQPNSLIIAIFLTIKRCRFTHVFTHKNINQTAFRATYSACATFSRALEVSLIL